jgi:Rieske Fe-S protein
MLRPTIHRRSFLAACAAVPFAGACARIPYVAGQLDGDRLVVAKSAFGVDPFAMVEVPGSDFPVYVHRHGAEDYSAVLTRCTHRACTVEPEGARLVCPCHGSEYSPVGTLLKGPAQRSLQRFGVTTDETRVIIQGVAGAGAAR